jgi:hypothetical protein
MLENMLTQRDLNLASMQKCQLKVAKIFAQKRQTINNTLGLNVENNFGYYRQLIFSP